MKKSSLSLFFCLVILPSFCQVHFSTFENYKDIISALKKNNKILHVFTFSSECEECNLVAMETMKSNYLTEKYNNNFISISIHKSDPLFEELSNKVRNFSYLPHQFISSSGYVIHSTNFTTSNPLEYLKAADNSISKNAKTETIEVIEKEYLKERSKEKLAALISALRGIDIYDCQLMDQYFETLTPEEKSNEKQILFLQQQGCNIYSKTYQFTSSLPSQLTNKVWYTMPVNERISINSRFRKSSFDQIVKNKDNEKIFQLKRNVIHHHNNSPEGVKMSDKMLSDYYFQTSQFELFEREQISYVSQWLSFSIDSLNDEDRKMKEEKFRNHTPGQNIIFRPKSEEVAMQLNNAAYQIYEKSSDRYSLMQAKEWSKKSIEILQKCHFVFRKENEAFYDTYAHLLYKLDDIEEALKWQEKAVQTNSTSPRKNNKYLKSYEQMKMRKL